MSATLLAGMSRTTEPQTMMRRFLAADAAVTGANGLAYVFAPGPLGRLLGVDGTPLLCLGAFLTAYAVCVALLAARQRPPRTAVTLVVDVNAAWSVLSVAALALWLDTTAAGSVWTVLQAMVVAGFAVVQWSALRAAATG